MTDDAPPDECIKGMGWYAERRGERHILSTPTGRWSMGELVNEISADDYARLRADGAAIHDILRAHNEIRGEGWTAQRDDTCVVYLMPERFPDNRRFSIPDEAFQRLREDPSQFDEIYEAYRSAYI